jgi:tellurite resistance protein TerA
MPQIQRGFRAKVPDYFDPSKEIVVRVRVAGRHVYDTCCFGLDASDKIKREPYVVFYNQKRSPNGEVVLEGSGGDAVYRVNLSSLPSDINKLAFTITIDGDGILKQADSITVELSQGSSSATLSLTGADLAEEKALIAVEVYRKDVWRFAAVASGFNGGLSALLKHFGGEEDAGPGAGPPPPPPQTGRVTLDKRGESRAVDLTKKSGGSTVFHVNLNWSQTKRGGQADLDLGCMFELNDGRKGVIQALGGNMGSRLQAPWIYLDQDDRSGASAEGENLYVLRPEELRRILVFCFIYEGRVTFTDVDARLLIKEPDGTETLIKLDAQPRNLAHCAACLMTNQNGTISIVKEDRYFQGHEPMDRHYGFGFRWVAGRK